MMSQQRKLFLCLYWHMHQPDYRDYLTDEIVLPWTYLHAIKDYTDMAYHLEMNPAARATFNFVPVLLDQLEEYARQFAAGKVTDPLLSLLVLENPDSLTEEQRSLIINSCFRSNHTKMIEPYPRYHHLYEMFIQVEGYGDDHLNYLSSQYMMDLLMWYHLTWTGESVRRNHELVARLMTKGSRFDASERRELYDLIGELISGIIPRYRKLAEKGQIELSSTPHFHPILPLLLDFNYAREAVPDVKLPENDRYPGGFSRAKEHIKSAMESHYMRFGHPPQGMWPAEGGVSHASLMMIAKHGIHWAATGEGVLAHSMHKLHGGSPPDRSQYLYKPYCLSYGSEKIVCFFRDDRLSDKIGFEYRGWHGKEAVQDFVRELEHIWQSTDQAETPVVSIILDGENAWEYFPYNAYYFLSGLYQTLAEHPYIEMSTFSEVTRHCSDLADNEELLDVASFHGANIVMENLPCLVAGSWVYGNFSTWIGSPDKNRGWDLLCEAKKSYDLVIASGRLDAAEKALAEHQLGDCESSDWFWWFGDYNSAQSVQSFDQLFRRNLANLYHMLKLPIPKELEHVVSIGSGEPALGGTMRRGQE
jgi:alpha-amylase/alpha-mannosidase (GH57 family)